MFGLTAIAVSFCGAPAVSWFTVTSGAAIVLPSSGLPGTNVGVIGLETGGAVPSSASCSMNAEKRICSQPVPLTEATLPASVEMSGCAAADALLALPASKTVVATATAATSVNATRLRRYRMAPLLMSFSTRPALESARRGGP